MESLARCHIQLGVVKVSHRDGKLLQMSWFHEEEAVKCHNFLLKAVKSGDFFWEAVKCQSAGGAAGEEGETVETIFRDRKWELWRFPSLEHLGGSSHVIVKILMREECS